MHMEWSRPSRRYTKWSNRGTGSETKYVPIMRGIVHRELLYLSMLILLSDCCAPERALFCLLSRVAYTDCMGEGREEVKGAQGAWEVGRGSYSWSGKVYAASRELSIRLAEISKENPTWRLVLIIDRTGRTSTCHCE